MNHDIDRVATNAQLNVIDSAFGAALAGDERQICAEALAFAGGGSQGSSDSRHQLPHLFDRSKRFGQCLLCAESIFPVSAEASADQCDKLLKELKQEIERVKADGKGAQNELDSFAIDYLIKLYASFISSRTLGADTPLYEQSKTAAIFAAAIYKLRQNNRAIERDRQDLLLISGDFFGIQKFIFDAVPASKAAKILRARSAFVQLLTRIIAFAIVDRLELSYQSIISTSAGKFEILGVDNEESRKILDETQRELNEFFIKEFFGETGVGICYTPCAFADFNEGRYKTNLRNRVAVDIEKIKFNKFDLLNTNPIITYDDRLDNATLCEYCEKRKKIEHKESCTICDRFINIGEALATANFLTISKNNGDIPIFGGYFISFDRKDIKDRIATFDISNSDEFRGYAKWELSSYVKRTNGKIDDFETLAKSSCGGEDKDGLKAIMSLKGDVDGMGKYIKESDATNSFAKFNFFSRMIDYFFSVYATNLMKGKNIYTVFAGGDDIFILGAWDEVIEYAKKLRSEFIRFAGSSSLTISMGFVLTKPNKPINFTAETAEENLESAKHLDGKDALSLFDETVKWNNYIFGSDQLTKQLNGFEHKDLINTAFLYRLLELIEMRRDQDKHIEKTIWKSKLRYSFYRNVIEKLSGKEEKGAAGKLLSTIDKTIDESYQTAKMALCEYIYKRREING